MDSAPCTVCSYHFCEGTVCSGSMDSAPLTKFMFVVYVKEHLVPFMLKVNLVQNRYAILWHLHSGRRAIVKNLQKSRERCTWLLVEPSSIPGWEVCDRSIVKA
ncbi:hypothetical protein AVEN_234268-1 [Araneus ventricosus]|uniref:Uncharacterized protein n=1 Tax=Araneus ventricosus TaxID=182803 RepID=A0A4Y2A8P7_ARAVE|nr:hypothetical protein AVEN_234268-1 [Araneus ventricosus]